MSDDLPERHVSLNAIIVDTALLQNGILPLGLGLTSVYAAWQGYNPGIAAGWALFFGIMASRLEGST